MISPSRVVFSESEWKELKQQQQAEVEKLR
jgi:hypothetical protein